MTITNLSHAVIRVKYGCRIKLVTLLDDQLIEPSTRRRILKQCGDSVLTDYTKTLTCNPRDPPSSPKFTGLTRGDTPPCQRLVTTEGTLTS